VDVNGGVTFEGVTGSFTPWIIESNPAGWVGYQQWLSANDPEVRLYGQLNSIYSVRYFTFAAIPQGTTDTPLCSALACTDNAASGTYRCGTWSCATYVYPGRLNVTGVVSYPGSAVPEVAVVCTPQIPSLFCHPE
jgi:hypothetical protein